MFKLIGLIIKLLILAVVIYFIQGIFVKPSLDRDWTDDQKTPPTVEFIDEDTVAIKNIRNISYRTTSDYDLAYYDRTIKVSDIDSAWFLVEPFGNFGAAHTLVSFGLSDGTYISISVEIRKEKGENFSPVKGLARQYELSYVIADESDVIKLRTNYREDEVRLYPIKTEKEKMQAVFVDMLKRVDSMSTKPEFYNTITNNCTTNIVEHVRKFTDKDIPWYSFKYLMPKYSDEVAYDVGIIDTDLPLETARIKFNITEKAQNCAEDANFSYCIRD